MPFSATNSSSSDLFVIQPLNNGVTKVSIITEGRNGSMYFFKFFFLTFFLRSANVAADVSV